MAEKTVRCPKCGQESTGYFCYCGNDLRPQHGVAVPQASASKTTAKPVTLDSILEEVQLTEYGDLFRANDVTDDMIPSLTDEDLKNLGIDSLGHRKKIISAIHAAAPSASSRPAEHVHYVTQAPADSVTSPSTPVVLLAIASFLVPGLGQLIQRRILAAAIHFFGAGVIWAFTGPIFGWIMHAVSAADIVRASASANR